MLAEMMEHQAEMSAEQDRETALLAQEFTQVKTPTRRAQSAAPDRKSSACAMQ